MLVLVTSGAFCQTVTFNDLLHFLNEKTEMEYIHSRGFKQYGSQTFSGRHKVTFYAINDQSPKTETLAMGYGVTEKNGVFLHVVGYTANDQAAANRLIKEITRAGFALTRLNPEKKWDVYRFEKGNLYVQVVISHESAYPNQVNINYRKYPE